MVISQVNKDLDCTSEKRDANYTKVHKLEAKFDGIKYHHAVREFNVAADVLANLGSKRVNVLGGVFIQGLLKTNVNDSTIDEPSC